tara:strand:- start:80411 stop:81010 length:600 start_codon:yes stop_codon:yes gene_type:complete
LLGTTEQRILENMNSDSLKHHFLIAMPQLEDPNFEHTLTYILEHNEEGAMGLTLNRPVDISFDDVLDDLGIDAETLLSRQHQVVAGGPVQTDAGFILHPAQEVPFSSSVPLQSGIWLTTSRDILEAIARGEGPAHSLMALGYAGWGAGQLEQEMAENIWLTVPASAEIIFDVPFAQRWQAAAKTIGVDIHLLSGQAGHG